MYTIDFGLFPFAALILGGCLYAIYYWGIRLKCKARWAQTFIVIAMLLVTLSMFVNPTKIVQQKQLSTVSGVSSNLQSENNNHSNSQSAKAGSQSENNSKTTVVPTKTASIISMEEINEDKLSYNLLFSDATSLLGWIYLVGLLIMLLYFAAQIAFLQLLRGQHEHLSRENDGIDVYQIPATHMPFSFGHSVFIPASLGEKIERYVLMHEMAHVRHRHYLWLCLLEGLLALNWYNPFIWILFREMHLQQELQVDTDLINEGIDREEYQLSLVSLATRQGKWILTQSAFFGEPLKKRLLFMNTPIYWKNAFVRLTTSVFIVCAVLTVILAISCHVKGNEPGLTHPFQGCWVLEGVRSASSDQEEFPSGKHIKFVGDYGDLTFICNSRNGRNINFSISAMEHRLHNDTLVDIHGRALEYKLKENQLMWRWHVSPDEEENGRIIDQMERWSRTTPDSQIVELFRAITYPEQARSSTKRFNGVWHLDSVICAWDKPWGKDSRVDVYTRNRRYLIINEPYYMSILYTPSVDEQTMNFEASGSCGELHEGPTGYIVMKDKYYKVNYGHDTNRTFLNIDKPSDYDNEIWHFYYRQVTMPDYLRRIFRPALTVKK